MHRSVYLLLVLGMLYIKPCFLSQQYDRCGERRIQYRGLLVGGNFSRRGMWPWQVGIYKRSTSEWSFLCGGALIAPTWVLTAAHCFYTEKKSRKKIRFEQDIQPVTKFKIRVGDHELNSYESSEQERTPQGIHIFPGYRHDPIFENDIALVKLTHNVTLGPYVRTVCLPDSETDLAKPGTVGTVSGWGETEFGSHSPLMRHSSFKIERDDFCDRSVDFYYNKAVAFCASDAKGNNAPCSGDSGGSMVRKVSIKGVYRWVTVGLVSWGGCALRNHLGYYTRLQPFTPWIFHKVNSTCMDLGQPSNGTSSPTKQIYQQNDVVKFRCKSSYTIIGNSKLTCQQDGTWNGVKPVCLAPCHQPAPPKNGFRFGNTFNHGQSVGFMCKPRHKLVGSSFIMCINGKWDKSIPTCAASCSDPGKPINGHRHNHSLVHGNMVMFSCEKGRFIVGKNIITCSDGRWDFKTPTCDGVHGGYSQWGNWSPCDRTCGDGSRSRSRTCTSPSPQHGGRDCSILGQAKQRERCNIESCPGRKYRTLFHVCHNKVAPGHCSPNTWVLECKIPFGRVTCRILNGNRKEFHCPKLSIDNYDNIICCTPKCP